MINVTIEQILKVNPILGKLVSRSYMGRIAFTLARLAREVTQEVALFDEERVKIVKKYADKDENGETKVSENDTVHITDENLVLCNQELNEILKTEIVLTANKVPIDWFENIELTIEDAIALEPFIDN